MIQMPPGNTNVGVHGRPGLKWPSACPMLSRTIKQASFASSIDQGGGKRRME